MRLFRFLKRKLNELDNIRDDNQNKKYPDKIDVKVEPKEDLNVESIDRSNWTGENFEFLIKGDIEIPDSDYDVIMTPNSYSFEKIIKGNWTYYRVGIDEFNFSWEISGIQFIFNKEVKYEKAKKIVDEIIENLNSIGQKAELLILESNKVYKF